MIKIFPYNSDYKNNWDEFVKKNKHDMFFFYRDYMEYHKDRFVDQSLMFYEENKLIAILPASIKEGRLICHGGLTYGFFILEDLRYKKTKEIFDAFNSYCIEFSIREVVYKKPPMPFVLDSNDNDIYEIIRRKGVLYKRDLTSIIDLKKISYNKGRKSTINKAAKENIEINCGIDCISRFYKILQPVLTMRHGVKPVHTQEELLLLSQRFPENIFTFVAMKDGTDLCGALVFIFGDVVHSQYLCNSEEGRRLGALDYLLDQIIHQQKSDGKKYFSFGISTENNGMEVNEGLLFQKESFGARNYTMDTLLLAFSRN